MRSLAYKVLYVSWISALLPTLIMWGFFGPFEARSALCGALIALFPAYLMAKLVLRPVSHAKLIAFALYIGEAIKWLVTFLLFAGAVIYLKLVWWIVFVSFGWAQFSIVFSRCENKI